MAGGVVIPMADHPPPGSVVSVLSVVSVMSVSLLSGCVTENKAVGMSEATDGFAAQRMNASISKALSGRTMDSLA